MKAARWTEDRTRPGLLAGFLRGPESRIRTPKGLARWLLLPLSITAAAVEGAHQVLCPSPQGLARRALARLLEGRR